MADKGKLLVSASTTEGVEKLLNNYYYSTSYKIEGENVVNWKGICPHLAVIKTKNKIQIRDTFFKN